MIEEDIPKEPSRLINQIIEYIESLEFSLYVFIEVLKDQSLFDNITCSKNILNSWRKRSFIPNEIILLEKINSGLKKLKDPTLEELIYSIETMTNNITNLKNTWDKKYDIHIAQQSSFSYGLYEIIPDDPTTLDISLIAPKNIYKFYAWFSLARNQKEFYAISPETAKVFSSLIKNWGNPPYQTAIVNIINDEKTTLNNMEDEDNSKEGIFSITENRIEGFLEDPLLKQTGLTECDKILATSHTQAIEQNPLVTNDEDIIYVFYAWLVFYASHLEMPEDDEYPLLPIETKKAFLKIIQKLDMNALDIKTQEGLTANVCNTISQMLKNSKLKSKVLNDLEGTNREHLEESESESDALPQQFVENIDDLSYLQKFHDFSKYYYHKQRQEEYFPSLIKTQQDVKNIEAFIHTWKSLNIDTHQNLILEINKYLTVGDKYPTSDDLSMELAILSSLLPDNTIPVEEVLPSPSNNTTPQNLLPGDFGFFSPYPDPATSKKIDNTIPSTSECSTSMSPGGNN